MLRSDGFEVYDFRAPAPGDAGFSWDEVDPSWRTWDGMGFLKGLEHPLAVRGFELDMAALEAADAVVLVLPCGRSAHLELGWAVGAGKRTAILLEEHAEAELMYRMADRVCLSASEILTVLRGWREEASR
jgi:nucleoside 2-deoxyribosyltransferase